MQVQDYLINIKANRGHCVLRLLCDMIQLLLMLGDTEYARAVILHTRTMMYHEACPRLPFTDMFTEDVGTFSEEAGEIAISVTTRYTLGDHTADKLQHTNKMFRSIGLYRDICTRDAQLGHTDCSDHHLPDLARTVASTSEHFRSVLRALQTGSWVYYSNANAYEVRGYAHRFNREPPALVWRDVRLDLQDRLRSIDANFPRHWGAQYADLMGFVLPERGVLEQPSEGEDGHASEVAPQRRGRARVHVLRRQPDLILRPGRRAVSSSRSSSRGADELTSTISENDVLGDEQGGGEVTASAGVASSVAEPNLPGGRSDGSGRGEEQPESFLQTALRTRTVTRRRPRLADLGPFLRQSPTS